MRMTPVLVKVRPPLGWTVVFDNEQGKREECHVFPDFELTVEVPEGLSGDPFNSAVLSAAELALKEALAGLVHTAQMLRVPNKG